MGGWDRLAPTYDLQLRLERPALGAGLDLVGIGRSDRVLDLGTGTGGLLRLLAAREDAPIEAVGVDSSAAMLAAAPPLPEDWSLVLGDARDLPFPEAAFDVVTVSYLLHLLDRQSRMAVLREAMRVLRPGGKLLVVSLADADRGLLGPIFRLVALGGRAIGGPLATMRPLDPRQELIEAGAKVQAVRRVRHGYPSFVVLGRRAA